MSRKVFGLIVLVFVVCCNVGAKEFQFFNITPEDGLEETSINIVYQDYEGYVWIGTIDGLYKYDGYNLSSYKKINVDINSLSSSNISFIYEDKDKQLWVGTDAGLNVYNRTLDNFEQITLIDSSKKEVKIRIFDMLESEDDQLWAISNTGVYIIDNLTHVVKKPFHGFYGNNEILICQGVSKDANGNLYFAYVHPEKGGVLKYNLKTQAIDRIDSNHPNIKIKAKNITCITIDSKNRLWIGYFTDGAEVIDINTNKVVNFENIAGDEHSLSHNFVHNITEDNLGDIFIGTDNGLNYLEKDSKDIVKVLASSSNTSLLTNIINGKPYCSVDNSIWFPCKGGGVSVYDSRLVKFKTYKSRTDNDNSIIINQVLAFTEDTDHRVWFSSDGYGITSFNPETQLFNTYLHEDGDSLSLTNNKV